MNAYTKYGFFTGIIIVAVLLIAPELDYVLGYIVGVTMGLLRLPYMPIASRIIAYTLLVCITTLIGYLIGRRKAKS